MLSFSIGEFVWGEVILLQFEMLSVYVVSLWLSSHYFFTMLNSPSHNLKNRFLKYDKYLGVVK